MNSSSGETDRVYQVNVVFLSAIASILDTIGLVGDLIVLLASLSLLFFGFFSAGDDGLIYVWPMMFILAFGATVGFLSLWGMYKISKIIS